VQKGRPQKRDFSITIDVLLDRGDEWQNPVQLSSLGLSGPSRLVTMRVAHQPQAPAIGPTSGRRSNVMLALALLLSGEMRQA
jgi:hypothetical protein